MFEPRELVWLEHGGVAVTVNVRGGGEYGDAWHHAGWRENKHVRVDDFIAAGEYLIAHSTRRRRTSASTAIRAAACSSARRSSSAPICSAPRRRSRACSTCCASSCSAKAPAGRPTSAIPASIGGAWLRAISPLHNVRAGTHYPATYIVTSDHDVRVAPLHSYKFAAAMQAAQAGPAPILLRVDTESGHGGGGLRSQEIEQNTELLVFFAKYLGLPM